MTTKALDSRKINLIVQISKMNDEKSVRRIEETIENLSDKRELLAAIAKPTRKKLDVEQLKIEQNWKPSTREEIDELVRKINLQEPLEQLLEDIK